MASDSRWTGGLANRQWQRGTRRAVGLLDPQWVSRQVDIYRQDCYAARATLNPAYHPTAAGAARVIFHRGAEQAEQIRAAFERRERVVELA
jgi:hypothetical protein